MADALKVVDKLKYQLGDMIVRNIALSIELEEALHQLAEARGMHEVDNVEVVEEK